MQRGHSNATVALGALTAVLGVALLVMSLSRGGGALSVGVVVGIAFVFVGGARVFMVFARSRRPRA